MRRLSVQQTVPLWQRFFKSRAALIGEIIILVILSSAVTKEIVHKYQVQRQIQGLESNVSALEQKNSELHDLITYFNSEAYREEQARLKLGLQKPGESVVTVLGESTAAEEVASVEARGDDTAVAVSNPRRWRQYFFGS